ncbi:response regulator [Rhodococcus ruber]|nr:response regulator [Rhodococcus ruber]
MVEDDDSVADGVCGGLIRAGFEVRRVATGAAAVAAVSETGPDFVLLDLGLPDMDGTDVCRTIRAGSKTPIIVSALVPTRSTGFWPSRWEPTTTWSNRSACASSSPASAPSADAWPTPVTPHRPGQGYRRSGR